MFVFNLLLFLHQLGLGDLYLGLDFLLLHLLTSCFQVPMNHPCLNWL
uniref:Uncharacterized protein n=1 Tax=Arundo donax TaxID=35708 RepID=A0A0A9FGL1_ARUDO